MTQKSELDAGHLALEKEIQALKPAKETLRESANKFRTIVEQATEGILVLQEGQRKYYNSAWLEIIGYSSEEYEITPFLSLVYQDDFERIKDSYQALVAGSLTEQIPDFRIVTKSGQVKWLSIRSANIEWEGKPAELIFFQDVSERKQSEQAHAKSGAHLRRSQEVAHVGSWELDLVGRELFWSDETYRIFGLTRETLMDYETFLNCVIPEDRDYVNEKWLAALAGAPYDIEHRICIGDEVKWVHEKAEVEFDQAGNAICGIGVVIDITERRHAEEKLQASEQRYSALFKNAAIGIALVDSRGHPLVSNPALQRFLGYSSEELRDMAFSEFTHPDDVDIDITLFNELIVNCRDDYQIEKRYITKDGRTAWGRLTVSIVREKEGGQQLVIRMVEDITERKQIEQVLNENELKYRTVVEQSKEGIMVVQDYERKYYNPAFRDMTGYSEEEYREKPFMELIHPEDIGSINEIYQTLMSNRVADIIAEFRIYTKSGDIKWLSIHGTFIEWEGKPAGMVFANDITERKRWEQQIQSYQLQLKALASQLTLTEEQERRRIADELHDQVGQALAFARMQIAAAKKTKSDDQQDALLDETSETLKEAIQETRSLVFDLSSPLLNELGLNAAIAEWMKEHLQETAGLKAELIEIGSDQQLSADLRAILFRSVRELLNNVIRHARATRVRVTVEQTDTQLCITIQDNGIGFENGDSAPGLSRSGGYGLFSIQERMSALGGSCTIQSAPGDGTQITLCVPNQVF